MRVVDRIIEFVRAMDDLSPVEKLILESRINERPHADELQAARDALFPPELDVKPKSPWSDWVPAPREPGC